MFGRAFLHDPARVHDGDVVRDLRQHRQVVRDEQHREAELTLEALEQPENLRLDHDVERGRGLVRDDQGGAAGERHRDHHALLLATREFVRIVVDPPGGEAHVLEQTPGSNPGLPLACKPMHGDGLGDLVADRGGRDSAHARPPGR